MAQTDGPDRGLIALCSLTTLGDARAIPVCLAHLQEGTAVMRQAALQALATLTDAEHAEAVMQAVMVVRSINDVNLKGLANTTASTLIRRFGERVLGQSTSLSRSMQRPAPQ